MPLDPPIERGPKQRERICAHALVLAPEVGFQKRYLSAQPALVLARGQAYRDHERRRKMSLGGERASTDSRQGGAEDCPSPDPGTAGLTPTEPVYNSWGPGKAAGRVAWFDHAGPHRVSSMSTESGCRATAINLLLEL